MAVPMRAITPNGIIVANIILLVSVSPPPMDGAAAGVALVGVKTQRELASVSSKGRTLIWRHRSASELRLDCVAVKNVRVGHYPWSLRSGSRLWRKCDPVKICRELAIAINGSRGQNSTHNAPLEILSSLTSHSCGVALSSTRPLPFPL